MFDGLKSSRSDPSSRGSLNRHWLLLVVVVAVALVAGAGAHSCCCDVSYMTEIIVAEERSNEGKKSEIKKC
jgi:hypothetical protein